MRYEKAHGRVLTLQHDGAPPHTAYTTQEYLEQNNVNVLDWPAISPDMNCIENVWSVLSRALKTHTPQPQNSNELFQVLSEAWDLIPNEVILAHTSSMRCRVDQH